MRRVMLTRGRYRAARAAKKGGFRVVQADIPAWAPEGREGRSQEAIADQGRPWQIKAFWNPRCYQHLRCLYFIFCNWIVGKISNMCLNNRAIFLSSPGTVLGIVYLEHDFNFNSWTISNKIKHHFVSDSYHNAKTASNKYFKWSQSSTPPTPPQLLQFEGRTMDWTCLK